MASSSSSSSSFNPIHLNHPVAIKLTRNNFLSWQSQITPILYSHDLLKFLESSPPNKFLHPTYLSQINPAYSSWRIQDQLILCWLRSSLSDTILGQVASCTTSCELWTSLQSVTSPSLPSRSIRSSSHMSVTSPSLPSRSIRSSSHRSVTSPSLPSRSIRSSSIRLVTSPSGLRYPQQLRSQPPLMQNPLTQPTLGLSLQQPTLTLPLPLPKSLSKLLKEHDLPPGLFPKKMTGYNFNVNTGKITVNMPGNFDVFDLRFSNTVTGILERGRLNHIKGIRMESLTWEEVHCIKIKFKKGKLHLHFTGNVDKVRPFDKFTYHVKFDDKIQRF